MGQAFDQQVPFEDSKGVVNMEPLISRPKAKPMHYAGWLSFLEKFIFVPNQSNQAWRLRLLISTTFLIMVVAVGILLYPDHLCEPKRIFQGPLDSSVEDFCYPLLPASLPVDFSGCNNHHISLPEHNTGMVESVVDLTLGPNRSDPIRWFKCSFSGPVYFSKRFTVSGLHTHTWVPIGRPTIGRLASSTSHQFSLPEHNTGTDESIMGNILGPNQSDPVWQLRLLASFSLVVHATMGVLILPGDLQGVHSTYRSVMLITSFGVPIVVAVITLLVSIWLVPDPSGRSNWITGLSVANFSLLGGRLAVYWTLKRGTDNILRGEES